MKRGFGYFQRRGLDLDEVLRENALRRSIEARQFGLCHERDKEGRVCGKPVVATTTDLKRVCREHLPR